MNPADISIRAASWAAAQCVRHFCRVRGISNIAIDAFCTYLEDAATAASVVDWDARSITLVVSGMGDSLPPPLESVEGLAELLCYAHEVTASGMYAAWNPGEVMAHLRETAERSGLDAIQLIAVTSSLHSPGQNGWGLAITEGERRCWSLPKNLFNTDARTRAG
ncbi:MAG: hypothetical protein V4582_24985 [Pseudomonadota bacterium]